MLMQISEIVKLNIKLEWRKRQSILAVLLYVLTTTYLSYLVFKGNVDSETWSALFWIILIFAAVQAAFRSFQNEANKRFLLYFGMVKPQALILGKIIYNFLYLLVIGLCTFLLFLFFMGSEMEDPLAFLVILIIACSGFAAILTFVSGISAKAGDNPALPAILSIPLLFPQVLSLNAISVRAITGFSWSVNGPMILVLLLLTMISVLLSYVLFAYLWRD